MTTKINQPIEFNLLTQAKAYRHHNNTGGWIFTPAHGDTFKSVLFPADMSPADIKNHKLTAYREGELVGNN